MTVFNHEYTQHIVCPHCGYVWTGGWEPGLSPEDPEDLECRKCDKPFQVTKHVTVTYSTITPANIVLTNYRESKGKTK